MSIATLSKEELTQLRLQQNSVLMLREQWNLAQRGFGARIGEILRRYRRSDDERLRINLETGDIEVVSPSTVGASAERVNGVVQEILQDAQSKVVEG